MNARATLQQEKHRTDHPALDVASHVPPLAQRGFTLVDTMIAMTLVGVLALIGLGALVHRSGEATANREPLIAFLTMARAHAATQGQMSGTTGATVVVESSTNETRLTLFDGRPGPGSTPTRATRTQALVVPGRLDLDDRLTATYAITFAPDGTATAITPYTLDASSAVTIPPSTNCDVDRRLGLTYTSTATASSFAIDCTTGAVDPSATVAPRRITE